MILALTHHNGVRLAEVGFVLSAVAGAALAAGSTSSSRRRTGSLVGGVCLALGAVLLIVAAHWGHFG
jgi:hypothetical protein